MIRLLLALLLLAGPAVAQEGKAVGPNPPCSAFGTASGTCLQGAGALGTPSSGTVTNLTGTASININGTVGATTPTTGAFTTVNATTIASAYQIAGVTTFKADATYTFLNSPSGTTSIQFGGVGDPQIYLRPAGAGVTVALVSATGLNVSTGQLSVTSMTQTSAAQSGTVCYNSGTGAITYDATLGCLASTITLKDAWKNIAPKEALQAVLKMQPGSFVYKKDLGLPEGEQIGFNAEQLAAIDERLVSRSADGELRGVRYQQDSVLYAGAIQAIKAEFDDLRACQAAWTCRLFGVRRP